MKVTRLYILNYDDDENIMKMACELLSFGNKLVKISCGDEIVDKGCVVEALFKMCISELEFIVDGNFDEVINDLGYILDGIGYDVDMEFVVEVEDGYVYLTPQDIMRIYDDDEEDDCEPLDEESYYELLMFGSDREFEWYYEKMRRCSGK
jgi:hypothetical protein